MTHIELYNYLDKFTKDTSKFGIKSFNDILIITERGFPAKIILTLLKNNINAYELYGDDGILFEIFNKNTITINNFYNSMLTKLEDIFQIELINFYI